ncbi:MAG: hypothetical protein A3A89_00370 [Candidatus Magasanikbacteria bacterium RIFCSPLOWO2_01_FULL_33_34]|nr:MAG: hypothetical protein A3A89_00370 [Candidatus Magasanikbacteria bacterium RIFCSPLOWO2_01_FULL_33_34]
MRWLMNYLREVFCKHDWEREEVKATLKDTYTGDYKTDIRVSSTCKKCGYHKSYWKYLKYLGD